MARILIVDDEVSLLRSMDLQLSRLGHECRCVETIESARSVLEVVDFELAIVDIRLPDGNGLDLIRRIRAEGHEFPIIVLTAFGSIPNAVSAMREGTSDYIEKPIDLEQLSFIVERNLETERLRGRIELYERTIPDGHNLPHMIGQSDVFVSAKALANRVASCGVNEADRMPTILLTGETGTGKDLMARYIHAASPLARGAFVHVDCASLPRELIESELFGHEKGAFTDAKSAKRGLLEIACGGTVFLNEIAELPIDLQSTLLTALEDKTFRRVGGTRNVRMDARIIAATNADLSQRVEAGTFRGDLFYRLNVFAIALPPLRDRGDDVYLLADHLLQSLCRKYRKPTAELTDVARHSLKAYHWPGNIREFSHVLERAVLLQEDGKIGIEHLGLGAVVEPSATGHSPAIDLDCTLGELERRAIEHAMRRTEGNVSKAARILGISRGALRRRLASE